MFIGEGGVRALHWQKGARRIGLQRRGIRAGAPKKAQCWKFKDPPKEAKRQQGGQLQEWELPRALNLEEENSEYLTWTN